MASVANQLGRQRTLCEIYGAGGWDLRFEDMKRIERALPALWERRARLWDQVVLAARNGIKKADVRLSASPMPIALPCAWAGGRLRELQSG